MVWPRALGTARRLSASWVRAEEVRGHGRSGSDCTAVRYGRLSKCSRPWTAYATRAAERSRRDKLAAVQGFVFMHANAFNGDR